MIDYDRLKARVFPPVFQEYTTRDTIIYALGLNLGTDPLDQYNLAYVAAEQPLVEPMMAMTLARLGPWMKEPDVGIDYRKIVVGEIELRIFAALPPAGKVRGDHRVTKITDKGEGKGALVTVLRQLRNVQTEELLAEFKQVTFCRADGGFAKHGRHDPPDVTQIQGDNNIPPTASKFELVLPTSTQQALIYRLSGDMNPLHSDPEVARAAGFERPILHGLATMGMAGNALARHVGKPLTKIGGRLSAPVYPGDELTIQAWVAEGEGNFRIVNKTGKEVLVNGNFMHLVD